MDGLLKDEANAQPPDEETNHGISEDRKICASSDSGGNIDNAEKDSKDAFTPVKYCEDVTPEKLKRNEATNDFDKPKMDLKIETAFDSKANANILNKHYIDEADVERGDVGASIEGGAETGCSTANIKPDILPLVNQDSVINFDEPKVEQKTEEKLLDSKANANTRHKSDIDEADVKTGDVGAIAVDAPAEAGGITVNRRRYKKRKQPPAFIGPLRPIQHEDLEDIMNGVYDIQFDILDTDEEAPVLSSSNESCHSSDPEGWLVDSSNESDSAVGGRKYSAYINNSLDLIKTRLNEAKASKDRLDNTLNFVGTEAHVAHLDAAVRKMVVIAGPELQAGLDALKALSTAPIAALTLVKHSHLLETAARLCNYMPPLMPQSDRPLRSRDLAMDHALKISHEAMHILDHMMALFKAETREQFWKVVVEKVEEFDTKTKQMTMEDIYMLTEDPPACKVEESRMKRYPMMTIDNPRDKGRFADDECAYQQKIKMPTNDSKKIGNILKKPRVSQRSKSIIRNNKGIGKENRNTPCEDALPSRKKGVQRESRHKVLTEEILPRGGSTSFENTENQTACKSVPQEKTVVHAKPVNNLDLHKELKGKPCNATENWGIGSLSRKEFLECEDLLIDSDDSAPFSEEDHIASSLSNTIDSKSLGTSSGFQTSLDSGMFSGTSFSGETRRQTRSLSSKLPISDAQLLQSSDSDY